MSIPAREYGLLGPAAREVLPNVSRCPLSVSTLSRPVRERDVPEFVHGFGFNCHDSRRRREPALASRELAVSRGFPLLHRVRDLTGTD